MLRFICVSATVVTILSTYFLSPTASFQLQYSTRSLTRLSTSPSPTILHIGTGLTFDDGDQILVSAQKPLGIILEEIEEGGMGGGCVLKEFADPSSSAVAAAGVQPGDWLVAVQNADVGSATIEEVMQRIISAPKVVNLRFQRARPNDEVI